MFGRETCHAQAPLSKDDVKKIIKTYTDNWNSNPKHLPLWVTGAAPGDNIQIPGVTFSSANKPEAGMSIAVRAELIVLNQAMVPESLLSTFLHEYGHTMYRTTHAHPVEVDSEIAAIRFSLNALAKEGLEKLAYREADSVKQMASAEPYRTAIRRLASDPLWKKYSLTSISK
jgi:hypothetical protein